MMIGKVKGSYILGTSLNKDVRIQVGSLGEIDFYKGLYLYCGSALNGIKQRINRYLRETKKKFWHIDYLLKDKNPDFIFVFPSAKRLECKLADILRQRLIPIKGFGSSDCGCVSHLYFLEQKYLSEELDEICLKVIRDSGVLNTFSLLY
jgi:Uri superfamily endonuclease